VNDVSYILPYRSRSGDGDEEELDGYLQWLSRRVDLLVVDGSDPVPFGAHRERWGPIATHVAPDADIRCLNGKVQSVLTGLRRATHEHVIIADDDVRYDDDTLRCMRGLLQHAELVRPQNVFDPLPWHARWDTARTLVNRAIGTDHPGTLGVRRSFLASLGGYDGDVLFENLELVRTVAAAGGRVVDAPGLYVRRLPPTPARFLEQRPRQAYDDWAQPARLLFFLALGPASAALARRRPRGLLVAAGASILVAQMGRARHGGAHVFDGLSPFFAPMWLAERACMAWLAVFRRLSMGGSPYAGNVIPRAANSIGVLRRRFRAPLAG
jgi:hypothetical protein